MDDDADAAEVITQMVDTLRLAGVNDTAIAGSLVGQIGIRACLLPSAPERHLGDWEYPVVSLNLASGLAINNVPHCRCADHNARLT